MWLSASGRSCIGDLRSQSPVFGSAGSPPTMGSLLAPYTHGTHTALFSGSPTRGGLRHVFPSGCGYDRLDHRGYRPLVPHSGILSPPCKSGSRTSEPTRSSRKGSGGQLHPRGAGRRDAEPMISPVAARGFCGSPALAASSGNARSFAPSTCADPQRSIRACRRRSFEKRGPSLMSSLGSLRLSALQD
jgi:hypothetical protein